LKVSRFQQWWELLYGPAAVWAAMGSFAALRMTIYCLVGEKLRLEIFAMKGGVVYRKR